MTYVFSRLDSHLMTSSAVSLPLISAKPCSLPSSKSEACPYFMVGYFLMPNRLQTLVCKQAQFKMYSTVYCFKNHSHCKVVCNNADVTCMQACMPGTCTGFHAPPQHSQPWQPILQAALLALHENRTQRLHTQAGRPDNLDTLQVATSPSACTLTQGESVLDRRVKRLLPMSVKFYEQPIRRGYSSDLTVEIACRQLNRFLCFKLVVDHCYFTYSWP